MRVVTIGLDGFHTDLLAFTPQIRSLYETEVSGSLTSTVPPVTAPAWASFQTGVNQGKHGIFDFVEYDSDLDRRFLDGRDLRAKPVYEILDEAGYDCYVQNLPFALPARIDGDVAPSWLDGDDADPAPRDLFDRYDVARPVYPELDGGDLENVDAMCSSFETNSATFESILEQDDHDFYFYLVSETDWLQHDAYLSLLDEPDGALATRARDLLEAVDAFVARLVEEAPPDTHVMLLSDHGFGTYSGSFWVNDWLQERGYLEASEDGHRFSTKDEVDSTVIESGSIGQWVRDRWFWKFLRPLKNGIENRLQLEFTAELGIDLKESVAYCRSKDEKAIRFNEEHPDYGPDLVQTIIDELNASGYVTAHRAEELYEGPFVGRGGAIVLRDGTHYVKRGPVGEPVQDERIAQHGPEGILVGVGEAFDGGCRDPDLVDVAPTILHLFGLPVPESVDGAVLTGMLEVDRSVQYAAAEEYRPSFESVDSERADVRDRLDSLGYL